MKSKKNTEWKSLKTLKKFLKVYLSKDYLFKFCHNTAGEVTTSSIKKYVYYVFQTADDMCRYCLSRDIKLKLKELKKSFYMHYTYIPEDLSLQNQEHISIIVNEINNLVTKLMTIDTVKEIQKEYEKFYENFLKDFSYYTAENKIKNEANKKM